MNLKSADILCRVASELGDAPLDRLLDVINSANFDLVGFRGK